MLNKHIIEENKDHVICMICGKELDKIDGRHLKAHNISFEQYLNNYPNNPTITRNKYNKELESIRKRKEAKKEKENQTKIVNCIYCSECGNSVEVNINIPNSRVICNYCKELGKYDPSRDMSNVNNSIREKYGVENPSQLDWVQEKKKETINKNEETDPNYWKRINEKREATKKERYGEEANKIIHEISKKGMKDKYGREYALQIPEFNEKMKYTYFKRTGYPHPNYNPEAVDKCKQTLLNRYGVINPTQSEVIRERIIHTNREKYGHDYPIQNEEIKNKRRNNDIYKFMDVINKWSDYLGIELISNYYTAHDKCYFKCKNCDNVFEQRWNEIQQGYLCPYCYPRNQGYSKGEWEIRNFIEELGFSVIKNCRSVINPKEIDIYIPELKIGIEFDGIYWHSEENGVDKNYHLNKTIECENKGIRLIHIFEDEWVLKPHIVKARLKQILGVNDSYRINGRDCYIQNINSEEKREFLDNFHIQGKDNAIVNIGAFYKDELIAVMTFKQGSIAKGSKPQQGVWELNRFCTNYNYHIPGVASRLLEYFKNNFEWKEIFSYADRRWSNGNLYHKLGFEYYKHTKPNYWYIKNGIRIHRFNLRKKPEEPKELTESQLRSSEGYLKIWDCGNIKFKLENK